tara:strand:+ start:10735 stop:10992 length:258 start_codon:yes stop_codon:yes gene_type:complete
MISAPVDIVFSNNAFKKAPLIIEKPKQNYQRISNMNYVAADEKPVLENTNYFSQEIYNQFNHMLPILSIFINLITLLLVILLLAK